MEQRNIQYVLDWEATKMTTELGEVGLVNSLFSQDAGPPLFPIKVAYWNSLFNNCKTHIYDLNLEMYQWFDRDVDMYNLLSCIFGGYSFSFPFSAFLPFNEYPFEALPTINLLIAFMYGENTDKVYKVLCEVAEKYEIPYEKISLIIDTFTKAIKKFAKDTSTDDCLVVNMPSPDSIIPGLLLSYNVKRIEPDIKIIGAGNQINVPEVAQLALATGVLDTIISGDDELVINDTVTSVLQLKDSESLPPVPLRIYSDLNELPMPEYDGFDLKKYPLCNGLMIMPVETSRGCPFQCNFCSERLHWDMYGNVADKYRTKSIERTMKEITYLSDNFDVAGITFEDCTLNAHIPRFNKLLSHLKEIELLYAGLIRLDRLDKETIENMYNVRFIDIILGVESFSKDSIKTYNKGDSSYVDNAYEVIPELYLKGIIPQFNILLCHPYENYSSVAKAIQHCEDFARFIEKQGFAFTDAPVGTLCINYPSANYFRILKDSDFDIIYHKVPDYLRRLVPTHVEKYIKKIPYIAIRKNFSQYKDINKVKLSLKIYNLWSKDSNKVIHQKVAALSQHSNIILKAWMNHNIIIEYIKKNKITANDASPLQILLSKISKRHIVPISSLITEIEQTKNEMNPIKKEHLVPLLLTLSIGEIIDLRREKSV